MKRKFAWVALCMTMWSSAAVMAQQAPQGPSPYGNPGVYGYPGYPMVPNGPPPPSYPYAMPPNMPTGPQVPYAYPPNLPYGRATTPMPYANPYPAPMPGDPRLPWGFTPAPSMPYANPFPAPMPGDPRLPGGFKPSPSMPLHMDAGPKSDAAEPYLVLPDAGKPSRPSPTPKATAPESKPGNIVTEPLQRLVQCVFPPAESEPYTMYEGRRYPAEMRQDNTRGWAQANFIHWWMRRQSTPPLVTTGNAAVANPGALGNGDTAILLGGAEAVGSRELTGIQTMLGLWLDAERLEALEVGGFWLGRNSHQYNFASDGAGNPVLGVPLQFPAEGILHFSFPNLFAGSMTVVTAVDFHSLEMNYVRSALRLEGLSIDTLIGLRYLYLNDSININQNVSVLAGGAGFIPFNGVFQPAGANFVFNDSVNTTNRFYGGQIGARVNYTCGRFDLGGVLKVAFGATAHVSDIIGSTTLTGTGTAQGGTLAQPSNSARVTSTDFSVIPEFTATLGYQVTPGIRVLLGYTVLDWNRVQRAGNQIDRASDFATVPSQMPTSANFAPGTVSGNPRFPGTRTDFWAMGINVGIEVKY